MSPAIKSRTNRKTSQFHFGSIKVSDIPERYDYRFIGETLSQFHFGSIRNSDVFTDIRPSRELPL